MSDWNDIKSVEIPPEVTVNELRFFYFISKTTFDVSPFIIDTINPCPKDEAI